jgi:hypothetical protein
MSSRWWGSALLGVVLGLGVGAIVFSAVEEGSGRRLSPDQLVGALDEAFAQADPIERVARVSQLLAQHPATELPASAVEQVRQTFDQAPIPDGEIEFASFGAWWSRANPESAYVWLRTHPQGRSIRVFAAVFEAWGERDPVAAARAASQDDFELRREAALEAVVRGAARSSALSDEVLISALEEIPDRGNRRTAVEPLIQDRLARQGVDGLLRWVGALPPTSGGVGEDLVLASAVAISSVDPPRAAESLVGITRTGASIPLEVAEEIASRWSETDPLATLQWLSTLEPPGDYARIVRQAFQAWMTRDRSTALAWASQWTEDPAPWLLPIRAHYGFVVGHEDPEEGLRLLFLLPIDAQRDQFVRHVFSEWREADPDAALAWLEATDLPDERKEQLRTFTLRFKHRLLPDQAMLGPRIGPSTLLRADRGRIA